MVSFWISFQAQKHWPGKKFQTQELFCKQIFFFTEFLNFSFVPPILLKFCPHLPKPHYYPHHNNKQYCLPNTLAFPPLFYQPLGIGCGHVTYFSQSRISMKGNLLKASRQSYLHSRHNTRLKMEPPSDWIPEQLKLAEHPC